ncbi:hypothetical protein DFQ28_006799 [Apophysomyces sp. BC1034]|nr:hypothetical protein DFQ30_006608 [Apophysomyces sp. BC1015]KAG0176892.1 hypothetical protein DFQ29_005501 [Apophysomyces sp. BC1021]KAG0187151.1 hypothetical protein DFQ28_006799 [Apophysomyces sp. BC1034]
MSLCPTDPHFFQFKSKPQRQRRRVTKNRPSNNSQLVSILSQKLQQVPEKPPVLTGIVLFVDKAISDCERVIQRALDLGATVKPTFDNTVTHIAHGVDPSVESRIKTHVARAINNNVHVVSAAWIDDCYTQERRVEETCLPESIGGLAASSFMVDDNPFGIEQDELLSSDDEESVLTEVTSPGSSQAKNNDHNNIQSAGNEQAKLMQKKQQQSERIAAILETVRKTRKKEEEKRKEEIMLPPAKNPDPTAKHTLLAREERVDIWYDEQTVSFGSKASSLSSAGTSYRRKMT